MGSEVRVPPYSRVLCINQALPFLEAALQEKEEEIRSCFEGQGNVCLGKLFFHKAA